MADGTGKSELFGETLPGTSGDFIDTNDVEGHMGNKQIDPKPLGNEGARLTEDEDVEGHRGRGVRIPEADGGEPEGVAPRRFPGATGDDEDVEGHRRNFAPGDGGEPEGIVTRRFPGAAGDDEDVEGHFAKRAPGEIPHGERAR